jgi:hypothetical protein
MGYTQGPEVFCFIQTAAVLGINNRVSEIYGITAELRICLKLQKLVKQILFSWHMVEAVL